jgi:hypothetical protein
MALLRWTVVIEHFYQEYTLISPTVKLIRHRPAAGSEPAQVKAERTATSISGLAAGSWVCALCANSTS